MAEPLRDDVFGCAPHLEPRHSRAICHEIGERLRLALDRDRSPFPSSLCDILERFEEMDARARLRSFARNDPTTGQAGPD